MGRKPKTDENGNEFDAVVVSKEEAFWTEVLEGAEKSIERMNEALESIPRDIEFNKEIISLAQKKVDHQRKLARD